MIEPSNPISPKKRVPGVTISPLRKGYLIKLEPLQKMIKCAIISTHIMGANTREGC